MRAVRSGMPTTSPPSPLPPCPRDPAAGGIGADPEDAAADCRADPRGHRHDERRVPTRASPSDATSSRPGQTLSSTPRSPKAKAGRRRSRQPAEGRQDHRGLAAAAPHGGCLPRPLRITAAISRSAKAAEDDAQKVDAARARAALDRARGLARGAGEERRPELEPVRRAL